MSKVQVTATKVADIKVKAQLPPAIVNSALKNLDGVDGILVSAFYPLPEDDQVEVVERMGKGDNKDKVTSKKSVFGRARGVALTYEQDGETYGILDGEGNQFMFTGTILTLVKGEGADDDDADASDATE